MDKIYLKIIHLQNNYEFVARYLPALIFTIILEISIYYYNNITIDLGSFDILKIPLFITFSLIITIIPKMIATSISGFLQNIYWDNFGNSTIKFINNTNNLEYKSLIDKFNDDDKLILELLGKTREDKKLLSKNIYYGFFRNFSFLILIYLILNLIYFKYFIIGNIFLMCFSMLMIYISSQRYSEQICKSYIEKDK